MPPQHSMRLGRTPPKARCEVRQYRLRLGWTQAQLASRLGVRAETISQWERGLTCPTAEPLLRLAKALNTLAEALYPEFYRGSEMRELTEPRP